MGAGGFNPPPMSCGAIPQVAREFRVQFESHHPDQYKAYEVNLLCFLHAGNGLRFL